jgi:MFS family permease
MDSGLQMIPLLLGVSITAISCGLLASKFGRYKPYPIAGFALAAVGEGLLSIMDKHSTQSYFIPFLLITGIGIGPVNQMSILAAQNAVERKDIGTATATLSFTRTIGGVFGVAYIQIIAQHYIATYSYYADPRDMYSHAYGRAFLLLVPWAGLGLITSCCLKHVPLRGPAKPAEPEAPKPATESK